MSQSIGTSACGKYHNNYAITFTVNPNYHLRASYDDQVIMLSDHINRIFENIKCSFVFELTKQDVLHMHGMATLETRRGDRVEWSREVKRIKEQVIGLLHGSVFGKICDINPVKDQMAWIEYMRKSIMETQKFLNPDRFFKWQDICPTLDKDEPDWEYSAIITDDFTVLRDYGKGDPNYKNLNIAYDEEGPTNLYPKRSRRPVQIGHRPTKGKKINSVSKAKPSSSKSSRGSGAKGKANRSVGEDSSGPLTSKRSIKIKFDETEISEISILDFL